MFLTASLTSFSSHLNLPQSCLHGKTGPITVPVLWLPAPEEWCSLFICRLLDVVFMSLQLTLCDVCHTCIHTLITEHLPSFLFLRRPFCVTFESPPTPASSEGPPALFSVLHPICHRFSTASHSTAYKHAPVLVERHPFSTLVLKLCSFYHNTLGRKYLFLAPDVSFTGRGSRRPKGTGVPPPSPSPFSGRSANST